jgi:hypothetical protein
MAGKILRRERTLERGETEEILVIVAEGKLHEPIAESADSVVEQDRVGENRHGSRFHRTAWPEWRFPGDRVEILEEIERFNVAENILLTWGTA